MYPNVMQFITFQDYKLWRDERLTGLIWKQMAVFAFTYLKLLKTYHRIARRIANFYLPYFYYFYLYFFTYTFIYNKYNNFLYYETCAGF